MTLLALVLAIGLVVDDAIIVVENVSRHLEEGATPLEAALHGARELGGPIIAMALVLVAVYVPIGFIGGLTGALFVEFAFTLVGAVVISFHRGADAVADAVQPHPALASGNHDLSLGAPDRGTFIDARFERLRHGYQRLLHASLNARRR